MVVLVVARTTMRHASCKIYPLAKRYVFSKLQ